MIWKKQTILGSHNGEINNPEDLVGSPYDWYMHYGQQPNLNNYWKTIISTADPKSAQYLIDKLILEMENNNTINGFLTSNDTIYTESMSGFKLDDKNLYYLFFNNLKKWSIAAQNAGKTNVDNEIIFKAIKDTVFEYLGPTQPNARSLRAQLTNVTFSTNQEGEDEFIFPSISQQKGKGTGICTEQASITHNLWLLAGKTSYFITSRTCQLDSNTQDARDGHSFCIVEYNGKYRMCDFAMQNFGIMEGNPIDSIKNGTELTFGPNNVYISGEKNLEK